jgi:hypothetical protein
VLVSSRQHLHPLSPVPTCGLPAARFAPWFVEPVIAGLEGPDHTPFVSGMDLVGAPVFTSDFVVSGTCSANLYGMCESLYRPDMVGIQLRGMHPCCCQSHWRCCRAALDWGGGVSDGSSLAVAVLAYRDCTGAR